MILFFQKLSLKTRLVGVIVAFLGVVASYLLVNSTPFGVAQLREFSGGRGLLENLFWFTPQQAQAVFSAWGPQGQGWYTRVLFPLGLFLPVFLAGFFTLVFLYMLKRINPRWSFWYLSPWLALAGGGIDLLFALHEWVLASGVVDFDFFYWTGAVLAAGRWLAWGLCLVWSGVLLVWHAFQRLNRILAKHHESREEEPEQP